MPADGRNDGAGLPQSTPLRVFGGIVGGMNATGSAWILALMLLINADAFARTLFAAPIVGVVELVQISIVGIVFMQLADSLRQGVMTRSDGLFNQVMERRPKAGRCLGAVTHVLGAIFMALVLYGSYPLFVESWELDHYIGIEGVFTAPMWPIRLVIVVAALVTAIQFLVIAAQFVSGRGADR